MKTPLVSVVCLGFLVGVGAVASAQAGDTEPPPSTPPVVTTPPVMVAPPPTAPVIPADAGDEYRPVKTTIGIGIGYVFPQSLETPNVTSVRVRLRSGLTIEPRVILQYTSATNGVTDAETTTSTTQLDLGALIRYPVVKQGHLDLEIVGTVDLDTTKTNPDGDNNDVTQNELTLGWGVALQYWFSPHWNLSLTATNPLFSYTNSSTQMGPGVEQKSSQTDFGAIFNPSVFLMVHLYN